MLLIFNRLWTVVVTMTTVGYGDYVPLSWESKIIFSIAAIVGMMMISLPVAILGH